MITYLKGDATRPQGTELKIIAHVCNDSGGWGRGFVKAISKRWSKPEEVYRRWHRVGNETFKLGAIHNVHVARDIWVCNMIAQKGYRSANNPVPLQYDALKECLIELNSLIKDISCSVHMPRIGCGLAGGKWDRVEEIINSCLEVPVFVYDL